MLIAELTEAFLTGNQHSLRPNTRLAYGSDLGLFARAFPDLPAAAVTIQHLRAFLAAHADLAPSTLARRQASLRACFAWAYRHDYVPADPTAKLEPVRIPQREPRPLTEEQAEAILAAIPSSEKRNRLLFTLLCETGMRIGEALSILIPHISLNEMDGGYIRIIGKGDAERIVPLIDAPRTCRLLREALRRLGAVGPLFRGELPRGGSPGTALDYTTAYYHFERYLKAAREAGPALFAAEGEPVTIHRFRHTYATARLRDGVSLATVRRLLGHRNIQTTLRYANTDLAAMQAELVEARRKRARSGGR